MSQAIADRNLLFGVLALHMDFVTRDQLVAGMQAWLSDKATPLGQILRRQGALAEDTHTLLEGLVQKHLALHGNDAGKSLAAVGSASSVRQDLKRLADADLHASLANVGTAAKEEDPYATAMESADASTPTDGTAPGMRPGSSSAAGAVGASTSAGQRFRILRAHARGGLGEVLVAQDQELPREVALKQIRDRHADNPDSKARFLLEAEITGGLEHPGIVPVYGLGTYPNGRPFYAMRFIRGDSLKDAIERFHKADAAGLSPGKRTLELRALLRRFVDVCNAMAYAHSRGVLHRDLKPDNIMLGKYGETLVVDWGLAKLVDVPDIAAEGESSLSSSVHSSTSSQTQMGSAMGTPQFMSPEQAAGRLDQLTSASDVYSLGATLYCLLTGQPPVNLLEVGVVLQKVQHGEFPRPTEVKGNVPGPLEAICLKAMALNPRKRYASAAALADDIEHWLADEPGSAWVEPWTVKARRWLGRHRILATGVATAVVVATVILAVATLLLKAANNRESQARELAEHNFQLARQAVDRYHTEVSESVLLREPGLEPLRKKLLEAAREFYDQFVRNRGRDADVHGELGKALFRLAQITGDIDSQLTAIDLHQEAVKIFEPLAAANPTAVDYLSDLADCLHHLGRLNRLTDQIGSAEMAYEKALAIWEQLAAKHPNQERYQAGLARTQLGLGNVYLVTRRLDQAEKIYEQALTIRTELAEAHPGVAEYQRELAVGHHNLAMAYQQTGRNMEDTEKAYRKALAIRKQLHHDQSSISQYQEDLAATYSKLGDLYVQAHRNSSALEPFQQAVSVWQLLVRNHPAVNRFQTKLAEACTALSNVYRLAGNLDEAEKACQQALAIQRTLAAEYKDISSYQGDLARGCFSLGNIHRSRGQMAKAQAAYEEGLLIQEGLVRELPGVPQYQSELATTYNNLGLVLADKNGSKAAGAYHKALVLWEKLLKAHAGELEFALGLSLACYNLGNLSKAGGKLQVALDWHTRAFETLNSLDVKKRDQAAVKDAFRNTRWKRAEILTQMGRHAQALEDWNGALELAREADKPWFQLYRAEALGRGGDYQQAIGEAGRLAKIAAGSGVVLYRLACVYSLSAAAAAADGRRPVAERRGLADQYAARAVELVALARAKGFFKIKGNLEKLKKEPDLEGLRTRPDFKKLLSELETQMTSRATLPRLTRICRLTTVSPELPFLTLPI